VPLSAIEDGNYHKLYFIFKPNDAKKPVRGGVSNLIFSAK
jgi:hypothetical protein